MFDIFIQYFQSLIEFLGAQLVIVLAYPLLPGQRIFWLYLCTSSLLACYVFYVAARPEPAQRFSLKAFIRFLLPKEIWRRPSAWLDVRYFFFHQIFRVVIYGVFLTGVLNLVFQIITGGPNLIEVSTAAINPIGMAMSTAYMFALIAFVDLVAYAIHALQHKVPLLWECHRVHHSLEVMHPLSNYREHPIDCLCNGYRNGLWAVYGPRRQCAGHRAQPAATAGRAAADPCLQGSGL